MIISYRDLARIRQREIVRRAEKRRLEVHAGRRHPQVKRIADRTSTKTASTKSVRAA